MARTAILRYSNIEGPAIALHAAVLGGRDFVYWGWWKKETEPFFSDVLRFIRDSATSTSALRVGLLSRKDEEYYAAECVGVEFRDDGRAFECPDKQLCPEYYRETSLPAWFKFTRFDPLDQERFKLEFGATPQLDPTLYNVVRTGEGFEIVPRSAWTMEPVAAPAPRILHLSDLHFGVPWVSRERRGCRPRPTKPAYRTQKSSCKSWRSPHRGRGGFWRPDLPWRC